MKILLFAFLAFFKFSNIIAQTLGSTGIINGRVVDDVTKQNIEYASITLYQHGKQKPINGTTSDNAGEFAISSIPFGTYKISINFIGYNAKTIDNILISEKNSKIELGVIAVSVSQKVLQTIEVTAKTPIIENRIDKMVYNAANDITSQGGLALDVLKKVPQVNVDVDGNVELQGNSNIRFLINGKPSSIFGASVSDALASIPASQIKSIEVITSPGAKYDAEGTGGIINIILMENKLKGINGSINLSGGTRLQNGSANFNLRSGRIGLSAFFSGNGQINTQTRSLQDQTSTNISSDTLIRRHQDGNSNFRRTSYQSGLTADWAITKKDNITAGVSYNHFENNNSGLTNQNDFLTDITGVLLNNRSSERNSINKFKAKTLDYNLTYRKTFNKDGQELNLVFTSSQGKNQSEYSQQQNLLNATLPFSGNKSRSPGLQNETQISLDYTHPIAKKLTLETGFRTTIQTIISSANVNTLDVSTQGYGFDASQSYNLFYKRKVYAGYLSASFSIFNFFDVKTGGRLERTNTTIDFPNTSIPKYYVFAPSALISHTFKGAKTLKLSYTRRIERPDFRELNPFQNLSDPYNINTGNPLLKPEIGNNFELGYNKSYEKGGNIYIAFIVRYNTQDIKPYTINYPQYLIGDSLYSNVNVSTRVNVGQELNTGFNISASMPLGEKFNVRTNIFASNRHIVNELDLNNRITNGFGYRVNLNGTYQLKQDFIVEIFGNYNSAFNNVQGRSPQFFSYNFAFRKQLLEKKLSIGATTTNPFSQYVNQISTVTGYNFRTSNIRLIPYRSFGINVMYKFGKLEFKKDKQSDYLPAPIEN